MKKIFFNYKKHKHINYGFFTRLNGFSKGNFSSLNCSISSKDNTNIVKKNIKSAISFLKIKNKKLILPKQMHSNIVKNITKKNLNEKITADGLITNDLSIAIGILTADCAPIFIFDKKKKFICCLHAGWKGCLKNIFDTAIKKTNKYNNKLNEIIVVIGPCLGGENFEVDYDFKKKFLKKNNSYKKFFLKKNKYKFFFDMRGLINYQIKKIGLSNVFNINKDTYKNNKWFFSHRRATHQNNSNTGRMINIISFK